MADKNYFKEELDEEMGMLPAIDIKNMYILGGIDQIIEQSEYWLKHMPKKDNDKNVALTKKKIAQWRSIRKLVEATFNETAYVVSHLFCPATIHHTQYELPNHCDIHL